MTMIVVGALLLLAILAGLFANTGRVTYQWLKAGFSGMSPAVYATVFGLLVVLILTAFILSRIPYSRIPRIFLKIGHYALGFLVYAVIFVNTAALLLFLGRLAGLIPSPIPGAVAISACSLCAVLIFGVSIYGIIHAAAVQTSHYTVALGEEQAETESFTIALISDLHMGYVIEEVHLTKVVAAVNEIKPDIVCISGDIFDGDITALSAPGALQSLFGEIETKYGIFACLGNHDAGTGYEQMVAFLSDAGVRVLQDESVVIDDRVLLVGRKDSSPIGGQGAARAEAMQLPPGNELPVIVLDHQPGNIGQYGEETDLILSGHTHQGQLFPGNLVTKAVYEADYGYYRASETSPHVVVTSGAGTWGPPQRVGTDNEVAAIEVLIPIGD